MGTEQGAIHKCSTAYDSDYLQTYGCHFMHVRMRACAHTSSSNENLCISCFVGQLIITAACTLVCSPSSSAHMCSAAASPNVGTCVGQSGVHPAVE